MTTLPLSRLPSPALRRAAEQLDKTIGDNDQAISAAEVNKALAAAAAEPSRKDELQLLSQLKTFLTHFGADGGSSPATLSGGGYSPLDARTAHMTGTLTTAREPFHVGEGRQADALSRLYQVGGKDILERQSILVPLEPGQLHIVELRYQDTRKLRDIEFNYREPGSYDWKTFRGDQWFEMERREKAGEIQIKREPDHNAPWMNNPVRVKIDILYPDGRVHDLGKKLVDFHVHDARSPDGSGSGETDNIYKMMPSAPLPPGCILRLTPYIENKKPWEANRDVALRFEWVKPIHFPEYKEKVRIQSGGWGNYKLPPSDGYNVDPNRKIAAVMVNWTDEGGYARGSVSVNTERGRLSSDQYNVGSGETELIPVNAYAKDGKLFVHGHGIHPVKVGNLDVLYAE